MSIFKKKNIGLTALLAIVVLSLTLAAILPVLAENAGDVYYTVTVASANADMGTVAIVGTNPHPTEPNKYLKGSNVTIQAVAKTGYDFDRWDWTEGENGKYSEAPTMQNQVVSGDRAYVASFSAQQYRIVYPKDDGRLQYSSDQEKPQFHVYGTDTKLPVPSNTEGYTFKGWKVVSGEYEVEKTGEQVLGKHEFGADIYLYPLYEENMYDVTCEDRTESGELLGNPQRKPYKFATEGKDIPVTDWDTRNYYGYTHASDKYQALRDPVQVETELNVVTRIYTPNTYTAVLDFNAADASGELSSVNMVYSMAFPVAAVKELPTRTGYVCMGYFLDVNNNGQYDSGDVSFCERDPYAASLVWSTVNEFRLTEEQFNRFVKNGKITLKARWEKVSYGLTFNAENPTWASYMHVTVESEDGVDYTNRNIPYDTKVNITVTVDDGYKLVKWRGNSIKHTNQYTASFTVPAQNTEFLLTVLPDDPETPAFLVDYAGELLTSPSGENGSFRLEDENRTEILSFSVSNGVIVGRNNEHKVSITDYLGTKIYLIRCGDGVENADSDAQEILLARRPDAVEIDHNVWRISNKDDNKIELIFMTGDAPIGWEFACSTVFITDPLNDGKSLAWQDSMVFDHLDPGTTYHVYARIKATATAPHGHWSYVGDNTTQYANYIYQQINHLNELMNSGIVGVNVTELVEAAKAALEALRKDVDTSTTFYQDADSIVKRVESYIALARIQDQAIADLKKAYDELVSSGRYSEDGCARLKEIYDEAVQAICGADADIKEEAIMKIEVDKLYGDAIKNFDLVPISYLESGDVKIYAEKGMDKEYSLSAKSQADSLAGISAKIKRAINSGSVSFASGSTTAKLINSLKTTDVLGYYRLKLGYRDGAAIHTVAEGPYRITLTLTEDLRDDTGFYVVYYNETTGWMTVMEPIREGNELIFYVDQSIEDFVILGDHAVNVVGVSIALAVLILAQIIAICVISGRRRHYKKATRLNGFILPVVALEVRFYPVTVVQAVIVQVMLVVILQIMLILLLAKTDIVPRRRRRHSHSHRSEPQAYATAEQITSESANETAEADSTAGEELPVEEELSVEEMTNADYGEENGVVGDEEAIADENTAEDDGQNVVWYDDEEIVVSEDGEVYADPNEDANGYSLEYDSEGNGYTLEYDNETVEYTDEEFDGEGEGYVEYVEEEIPDGAAFEAYDEQAYDEQAYDEQAYDDQASYEQIDYEQIDYEQVDYEQGDGNPSEDYVDQDAPTEDVDYGYDVETADDDSVVYYDYAEAQDVLREDFGEASEQ